MTSAKKNRKKKERAAELVASGQGAGGSLWGCGPVPDCGAVAWAPGSILLGFGFVPFGGFWLFLFFSVFVFLRLLFSLHIPTLWAGRSPHSLPGCVKVYHGSARFGNKKSIKRQRALCSLSLRPGHAAEDPHQGLGSGSQPALPSRWPWVR